MSQNKGSITKNELFNYFFIFKNKENNKNRKKFIHIIFEEHKKHKNIIKKRLRNNET